MYTSLRPGVGSVEEHFHLSRGTSEGGRTELRDLRLAHINKCNRVSRCKNIRGIPQLNQKYIVC